MSHPLVLPMSVRKCPARPPVGFGRDLEVARVDNKAQPSSLAALAQLTNPVASPRRKGLSNLGLLPWKSPFCFVQQEERMRAEARAP